jgi:hypothetical protein
MHRSLAALAAVALASGPLAAQTPPAGAPSPAPAAPGTPEPPVSPDPAPIPAPAPAPTPGPAPESAEPEPEPAAPKPPAAPDDEAEPPPVPRARDTLGGHFVLGASAAFAAPFGHLDSDTASSDVIGIGPGFGADIGVGVSRAVVLGLYGQLVSYSSPKACSGCSGTSTAAGVFVRYHLVQGTRYDPWISAGIGYRGLSVDRDSGSDLGYSGVEWLRLQVGGDWYPLSVLGLGPFLELDAGSYFAHDDTPDADTSVYVNLLAGARVVLDFPGK